jgi:hypothetical protein
MSQLRINISLFWPRIFFITNLFKDYCVEFCSFEKSFLDEIAFFIDKYI